MEYPKEIQEVINMARKVNTLEELAEIYDKRIEKFQNSKYYRHSVPYVIKEKEEALKEFSEGKKVCFLTSYDHFGYGWWGEDTITRLYTDGTWDVETHLAD